MVLNDEATWPRALVARIAAHRDVFLNYELRHTQTPSHNSFDPGRWDRLIYEFSDFIGRYSLHGYHCTRLTEEEIAEIIEKGMTLPDAAHLCIRINRLRSAKLISASTARRLLTQNDADAPNRKHRLWFCFFPPRLVPQQGIERFFRSWGGEALYCDHESDPVTGPILNTIGIPCMVEANVPIKLIDWRYGIIERLGRQFLLNRGLKTREPVEHEDNAKQPLPAACIRNIIRHPSRKFLSLTECDSWDPPLTQLPVLPLDFGRA